MNGRTFVTLAVLAALLAASASSCCPLLAPGAAPTAEALPTTNPVLVQRSPARGEETPLDMPLTLVFDQPMDATSVEDAFSIQPTVAGALSWPDATTMVFTPRTEWGRAARYRVHLTTEAESAQGLSLREELDFAFATVGYLEVTQVIPEPDTAEVDPTATVTVMFNRPVVPLQLVSATTSDLPSPLQFDPPVEGSGEWINTSIYLFRADPSFVPGQTYQATVAAGLTDTTGGVLEEEFSWTFTIQAPYVASTEPASGEELVALTRPITVTFSQPMDPTSTRAAFSLRTSAGEPVPGQFSWTEDHSVLTFVPQGLLQLGTSYDVRVADTARAATGDATLREEAAWTFQTVPYPRIVQTDPADGTPDADPDASFQIFFSAPMEVSTLLPNITILPEPTRVYTYWSSYDSSFTLSWDIQPSTAYEVRLGAGMADPYGNTIDTSQVVRFTTRALDPMVYLAVPGNVGTYNAYTSTHVYVVHRNVSRVDLSLYRLGREEFADLVGPERWEEWETFDPAAQAELLRQWTVPTDAPLDETEYLLADLAEDGGALPPGLYYLEVSSPEVREREWWEPSHHIVVVSRIHLTLKLGNREALIWATDLATGQPEARLDLSLLGPDGSTLASGTTDADGVFQAELDPLSPEEVWQPYTVVAGEPGADDFAVAVSDWYEGIGPWEFGLASEFAPPPYRMHLYTDRPIYRPGQPVYFRGVVRAEDDVSFSLPTDLDTISLGVYDDQGQQIYSQELPLSDFGTFDGQLTLDEEASLGYYYIEARIGDQSQGVGFQVAEYRRPEFEVAITTDRDEVLAGEEIDVVVEATYFFGGPVADAPVRWTLLAQDYPFRPDVPGWWDWSDTSEYEWWSAEEVPGWGRVIADGEGTTDAEGRFVFSVPADISDSVLSQEFTIEATVTDVSDQSVSNRASVVVHKGLFYIGLRPALYVGHVGEELEVEVRTVDWDGAVVRNVPLNVTFSRREWLNVQEEDEYGNLIWTWAVSDTLVFSQTVVTDSSGEATAAFVPESGGTYIVRAEGLDEEGNAVTSATWLWVSSSEYVSWRQDNTDRIQLIADRRSYEPGDVAEILVPSPFQGETTALFTVERGRVLDHWVQTLPGNAQTVEIPITADYAPNVFVSVVLVAGVSETNPVPSYRVGYVSFEVSTEAQVLTVSVTPDRDLAAGEHYGPRDTVTAEVQVTDADGRPVEAEVGLAVVDEAVLSLAAPNAPSIVEAFYSQRGLGIRTADSLTLSVDRITVLVAEEGKGGGGGGAEAALGAAFIRQQFPDTAFWSPSVRTGADGQATIEFRLPDQLTTWHLDARAVDLGGLVGQTELEILSTKDLLIRPVTPRFFVVGDLVDLAAVVHNNTGEDLTVEVWLEAEGVSLLGDARHTVTVPSGGTERVEWPVQVEDAQWAALTFQAAGGGYTDATRPPAGLPPEQLLPIYHYSARETVGTAGQLEDEGSVLEAVVLPPSVDVTQGELVVRIEPSLAGGMVGGLDYLEHYPYECTEQVVSRFLPNVLTYRALVSLGLEDAELEANLREQVTIGLQRLYARQHYDGGWGWWVDDESNTLTTAYVVLGLVKLQEAGFAVDESVLQRGVDFLQEQISAAAGTDAEEEANRRAYVLYVLAEAGAVRESSLAALYDLRARLGHYGRAYLALGFGLLDEEDPRVRTLLSDLNSAAIVSASGAHWQEAEPAAFNWNTDTHTTAVVLDALARLDPTSDIAANAVRWLMHARTADHWETTQETAWALIALTDWMLATGELEADYRWSVRLNGEDMGSGETTPETVREVTEMRAAVAELLVGEANRVEIGRGEGPGRLYYTTYLNAYLPVEEVQSLNRGIIVGRTYTMAECEEDCPPVTSARVGDLLRARLTIIAPHDLYYVVVEDPFPAGTEPLDTSLQTTSVVGERPELHRLDAEGPWWDWGWWWFANTDLRDEKLVLFATTLPAGTYEYTYLLQVGLAGEYRVLPVTAYEMYFPEVMGRSDGMVFTIAP